MPLASFQQAARPGEKVIVFTLQPLWIDVANEAMRFEEIYGQNEEFLAKAFMGPWAIKLGMTHIIPSVLPEQTLQCHHHAREAFCDDGLTETLVECAGVDGLTQEGFLWAWETMYRDYPEELFVKMLSGHYGQVWPIVRGRLLKLGYEDGELPIDFNLPKLTRCTLDKLSKRYPPSSTHTTPFESKDGRVTISIPSVESESQFGERKLTFSLPLDVPDEDFDSLSRAEKTILNKRLILAAKHGIDMPSNGYGTKWNLMSFGDSKEHHFSMTTKDINKRAWHGDVVLHRDTREYLLSLEPRLPLACVEAAARALNSNAVQSAMMRKRGYFTDPAGLDTKKADHLGGTMFEGGHSLPHEVHTYDNKNHIRTWLKNTLRPLVHPVIHTYKKHFAIKAMPPPSSIVPKRPLGDVNLNVPRSKRSNRNRC